MHGLPCARRVAWQAWWLWRGSRHIPLWRWKCITLANASAQRCSALNNGQTRAVCPWNTLQRHKFSAALCRIAMRLAGEGCPASCFLRGLIGVQSWLAIPSGLTILSRRTAINTPARSRLAQAQQQDATNFFQWKKPVARFCAQDCYRGLSRGAGGSI